MIRLNNIARSCALAGVLSGCIALSVPAWAAGGEAPPQGAISIRDADFASPRAVAHLKQQVRRVALDICTGNGRATIFLSPDQNQCLQTAIKDGFQQIDSRQQQAVRERMVQVADARSVINLGN